MGKVLIFAFLAAWNPLLLAIVPVMLVSARPKRLMLGYLLGGYTVSITLGLIFVFAVGGSRAAKTTTQTVSPALELTLGVVVLLIALGLAIGLDERFRRRKGNKEGKDKGPRAGGELSTRDRCPWPLPSARRSLSPEGATSWRSKRSTNCISQWAGRSRP